jgi:hypothetical protein
MTNRFMGTGIALAALATMTPGISRAQNNQSSSARDIRVVVNGDQIDFDTIGPRQANGRVLVPLRGVLERLGAYVDWDSGTQTVMATREGMKIQLPIGSHFATVNGDRVRLDVPAVTINGTTMVPLRFLSESLGAEVRWNEQTNTVRISTGDQTASNTTDEDRAERRRQFRSHRSEDYAARNRDPKMPVVESVVTDFSGATVHRGERIHVTMRATACGRGYFRIRGVVGEVKMAETSPGVYELDWRSSEPNEYSVSNGDFLAFVLVGDRATAEKSPSTLR